ncbi:MAG: type II toxin-antitoxin system VapC family toxin [Gemmatimonadales bacterium]
MIVDTSLLIAAERGAVRFEALLDSLGTDTVAMAAITASELLHGCHRAVDPGVRARRAAYVDALLDAIPVLPFGLTEARRHAQLWAELARMGSMIGPHDMLIGATALARGDSVGTLNQREFARIAGLRLLSIDAFVT